MTDFHESSHSPEHTSAPRPDLTAASAVGDWSAGGDFLGSILAGLLIGRLADWLLGTSPWLTVILIVAGSCIGFWRMMESSKVVIPVSRTLWVPPDDEEAGR